MPEPYVNMQFEIPIKLKLAQEETDRSVKVVAVRRETQRRPAVQSAKRSMPHALVAQRGVRSVGSPQCTMQNGA